MFVRYQQHLATPSDIQHHLPLLFSLARGNVLELGTRSGVSTAALLAGVERHGGHVWSVDIEDCQNVAQGHTQWTFVQGDSRDAEEILHTLFDRFVGTSHYPAHDQREGMTGFDLILIDTFHAYENATTELAAWHSYVVPGGTILMHDTETFPGVRRAAQEFADKHGWPITFVLPCHGMAVITRPMEGVSAEGSSWAMDGQCTCHGKPSLAPDCPVHWREV